MKCSADPSGCLSVQTPASTGSETFPGYVPWRLEPPGFARRRFFRSSRGTSTAVRPGFRAQNSPSSIASSESEGEPEQGSEPIEDPEKIERSDELRRLSSTKMIR
ncbi:hypothetical protein ASPBRDRAFT_55628 [Aspergillus brasiliensis CBS 101740]|uniref:Uncharacterized protein n=1 Tax=Aspergillus brasiliensis (strain CBS 101740 / IMI 381727 / IBT 21946) TaxID=767769 RepID=A0A1L9UH87_ASPBC|nr:hypothetical protein ASPBRDRAFT_55628 [Aspergillus brasiliensis CBS 101740]